MSQTQNAGLHALREALYELSTAQDVPDAKLLDEVVRRYPQFADELTEFAIALAVDALQGDREAEAATDPQLSAAVSQAMDRFQDRLNAPSMASPRQSTDRTSGGDTPNPFLGLERKEFRALAERLNANSVFLCKLRDRQIEPATIPLTFQRRIADELHAPLEVIQAHLAARQVMQPGQYYKAEGKPAAGARQSFEEAVRSSGLDEARQKSLLEL
jgi:hypothetical protein